MRALISSGSGFCGVPPLNLGETEQVSLDRCGAVANLLDQLADNILELQ
jgi:hypothetical protein